MLFEFDIEHLKLQQSWQSRYKTLMQWGAQIEIRDALMQDKYLVKGCDTKAWLSHQYQQERHQFEFYAESKIIRGLGALLLSQLNNKTQAEIEALDLPKLFASLDLNRHLSPSRGNGFKALTDQALKLCQQYTP